MSAAQNKKKSNTDGFGIEKRNPHGKDQDKGAKTARVAIVTVVAVAVLFGAALFINSDYLRQNGTAVSIDNVKYSITDFNYYYENIYMQYYSTVSNTGGDIASAMLPDTQTSLKSQIYDDETGETWAEFFEKMALTQMQTDNEIYVEALNAGYQLTEEDKSVMETELANVQQSAYTYGYTSLEKYLKAVYGKGMTEEAYRECAERTYLISSYTDFVNESFTYTTEQIETYYGENKDNFDTYTYRYFLVTADAVNEADYADDAAFQTAKDAAVEAAGDKANVFASTVTDEETMIAAARAYDAEANSQDDATKRVYQGSILGSTYGDWMKEAGREYGDVSTFKSANGYYVVFYMSRSDNHYQTVNYQQVLVKPETINSEDYADETTTESYDAAVEAARQTAEDTANTINDEWVAAGATQDKLTELAETNAALISTADSVLYENVYKEQMPAEVTSWIYDASRKTGDHTVLYSESMGYYILYFVGPGKQYSDMLADTGKRKDDLQAWKDSLTGTDPKSTWLMTLAM